MENYPIGHRYVDRMDVANPEDFTPDHFTTIISAERTMSGNTSIRVGQNPPGTGHHYQVGLVVLTPDERETLIATLMEQR